MRHASFFAIGSVVFLAACGGTVDNPVCLPEECVAPQAVCLDAATLRTHSNARCEGGMCVVDHTDTTCPDGCADGACVGDPCAGVDCSTPPAAECLDNNLLRIYSAGPCVDGACVWGHSDAPCEFGCHNGACRTLPPGWDDASSALPANALSTTDVATADLDGDGDLDLAWANQSDGADNPGRIDITFNLGGGAFAAADLSGLSAQDSWSFVLPLDVDGDGDLDLVFSRPARTRAQLLLLRNLGAGVFQDDAAALPALPGETYGFTFARPAAGDLDGDGDPDLVIPIFSNQDFTADMPNLLLLNNGSGAFAPDVAGHLPVLEAYTDYSLSAAIGDLTGDGMPDIFVGEAEMRPHLLVNDGSGAFIDQTADDGNGTARLPDFGALRCYRSELVDLDSDGDLDVVTVSDVSTSSGNPVALGNFSFRNDGSGHFELVALPVAGVAHDSRGLAIGDIDGDGRLDLAIGNGDETLSHGGAAIEVFWGRSDGFSPAVNLPLYPGIGVFGVALGDLNDDGWLDLAAACAEPSPVDGPPNILWLSR